MNHTRNAAALVALTLIASVVTQLLYFALLSGVDIVEGWPLRSAIWSVEVIVFALMAAAALVGLARDPRHPVVYAALALAGVANLVQAAIGLGGFLPAGEAGDAGGVVLSTILGIAFVLYFLAKALIGLAGIGLGLALWQRGSGAVKLAGGAAVLVGLAAAAVNGFALSTGTTHVFPAGATGTAAAVTTALALWLAANTRDAG